MQHWWVTSRNVHKSRIGLNPIKSDKSGKNEKNLKKIEDNFFLKNYNFKYFKKYFFISLFLNFICKIIWKIPRFFLDFYLIFSCFVRVYLIWSELCVQHYVNGTHKSSLRIFFFTFTNAMLIKETIFRIIAQCKVMFAHD